MTCGQFRVGQSRRRPRHGRLRRHAAAIRRNDPAFKHYIADRARTDIRCFPSINSAGTLRGGLAGPIIHTPEVVDVELLVTEANAHPRLVRGFGEIDAETGAVSRWDVDVVRIAPGGLGPDRAAALEASAGVPPCPAALPRQMNPTRFGG